MRIKTNTHIVIKREDVDKHLNEEMKTTLGLILSTISVGRLSEGKKATNEYYICNTDEPYAEMVKNAIYSGEQENVKANESVKGDLISRSALIEKFDADFSEGLIDCFDDVIGIVEEQPTVCNDGWIPCSERLPSESERWLGHDIIDAEPREFIVMVKGAYEPTTGYYTVNGWVKDIYNKEEYGYANEIIAWRFFPQPYKENENED